MSVTEGLRCTRRVVHLLEVFTSLLRSASGFHKANSVLGNILHFLSFTRSLHLPQQVTILVQTERVNLGSLTSNTRTKLFMPYVSQNPPAVHTHIALHSLHNIY